MEEEKDDDGLVKESKMKMFEYVAKSSKSNNAKNLKSTCGDNLDTKLSESSMSGDDQIFKSICGGNLKKKLADTAVKHFKQNSVDVHITGPFHHSGKSHWVVVCVCVWSPVKGGAFAKHAIPITKFSPP